MGPGFRHAKSQVPTFGQGNQGFGKGLGAVGPAQQEGADGPVPHGVGRQGLGLLGHQGDEIPGGLGYGGSFQGMPGRGSQVDGPLPHQGANQHHGPSNALGRQGQQARVARLEVQGSQGSPGTGHQELFGQRDGFWGSGTAAGGKDQVVRGGKPGAQKVLHFADQRGVREGVNPEALGPRPFGDGGRIRRKGTQFGAVQGGPRRQVVGVQAAGAQPLGAGDGQVLRYSVGNGIEADAPLQGTGDPPADVPAFGPLDPIARTFPATKETGFKHHKRRF